MILKSAVCHSVGWMLIRMENLERLTAEGIKDFLTGSTSIEFTGQSRSERYGWITETLVQQEYFSLAKKERGVVRSLLSKVAGLSLPQITRLIRNYKRDGRLSVG